MGKIDILANIMFVMVGFFLFYVVDEVKDRRLGKKQLDEVLEKAKLMWPDSEYFVSEHRRSEGGWFTVVEIVREKEHPRDEKGRFIKHDTKLSIYQELLMDKVLSGDISTETFKEMISKW